MALPKTALIFVLAPFVGWSATLISHTREVSARATAVPNPEVMEEDSTLLDGFALLEAAVNPVPGLEAESQLESSISSERFWAPSFFTRAFGGGPEGSFSNALLFFEVNFEVTETETWFLDVFLGSTPSFGPGASSRVSFGNLTAPGPGFSFLSHPEFPVSESMELLLTPGVYRLRLEADANGEVPGGGSGADGSFLLTRQAIPEPATYLGVSAALAVLLLRRLKLPDAR